MPNRYALVLGSALAGLVSGCATVLNVRDGGDKTLFGGTEADSGLFCDGIMAVAGIDPKPDKFDPPTRFALGSLALADLPFSLVADTLTLAITIPAAINRAIERDVIKDYDEKYRRAEQARQAAAALGKITPATKTGD